MTASQFRGKVRLANWTGEVASHFTPEADCQPVPGARVTISLRDRIGRMMWSGCYEPELVLLLKHVLSSGMAFVDVGAQVGYFSTMAAALVGKTGVVHSFEPDPDCFSMLQRNASAYPWMVAHNCAVADFAGETPFFRSPQNGESGWGAIFAGDGERTKISVPVHTLDGWAASEGIERIDVLKIDVEGAELRVLRGGRETIAKTRPLIWAEANEVCLLRDGKSVGALVQLLNDWDYDVRAVDDLRSKNPENLVAIPKNRSELLKRVQGAGVRLRAISVEGKWIQ